MLRVAPSFLDNTLWPEFEAISSELETVHNEITERVTATAIHGDTSDADSDGAPELPK